MADVLSGAEPASRRTRALVVALSLVALLALGGDRWAAARERDALLAAVTAGEQTVGGSRASVASLAQYASGALYGVDVPAHVRASAYEILAQDARRWEPRLASARRQVAAAPVLPWHGRTRTARAAYDQRLQDWADRLGQFADAPQEGFPVEVGAGASFRARARTALVDAGLDPAGLPPALRRPGR